MSKSIDQKTQDQLRQPAIQATGDAAKTDKVSIHADALAVSSRPGMIVVNAPVAGVENLDFEAMLDGKPVLEDVPVMYWGLSGDTLKGKNTAIPAGFYTVVAHGKRGLVSFRNTQGKTVAEGDLDVCIGPPATTTAKKKVTGGIDSFDYGWTHVKVCGHVKVQDGKKSVTISGCLEVSL